MQNLTIKIAFFLFFLVQLFLVAGAAPPATDVDLLISKSIDEKAQIHTHDVRFMRSRSKNFLVRYNPISLALGGLMYTYQRIISPQLPSECIYQHSCSAFSKDLIFEYGIVKGVFTTSDRLMRCNRLSALDVHPLLISEESGRVKESIDIYRTGNE